MFVALHARWLALSCIQRSPASRTESPLPRGALRDFVSLPKCVFVRVENSTQVFLQSSPSGAPQPGDVDLRGVLAIMPQTRSWKFAPSSSTSHVQVSRSQIRLLPRKQCTLHGVQGKTAEPGFIAHWTFPLKLSKEAKWLAYYVSLSRPRVFTFFLADSCLCSSIFD